MNISGLIVLLITSTWSLQVLADETAPSPMPEGMDHSHMHHAPTESASDASSQKKMGMPGALGDYAMNRESSGTSWQPDSTEHDGIHTMLGDWHTMLHGSIDLIQNKQSGSRGDTEFYSASSLMIRSQQTFDSGTLGLHGMCSLDPIMGKGGYPLLFQTGETADGVHPLIDRQHPHNAFMELAASYSYPLSADRSVFIYAGPVGEPALGPTVYMHRASGMDLPEAPISHHWLDSTHITNGVITLGYIFGGFKLETSAFHGREPDQFRYRIERGGLDSFSGRLTFNPHENWSMQISQGRVISPESLDPSKNLTRTTASLTFNNFFRLGSTQTTLAWGRNSPDRAQQTQAYLLESAYRLNGQSVFARLENVDKDELFTSSDSLYDRVFKISKMAVGYSMEFGHADHVLAHLGVEISSFIKPKALDAFYGSNPYGLMVFMRFNLK